MFKLLTNLRFWAFIIMSLPPVIHYTQEYIQAWVYEYQVMIVLMRVVVFTEDYTYGLLAFLYIIHVILFLTDKVRYGGNMH